MPSHLIMKVFALYVCFSILLRGSNVELAPSSGLIFVEVRPAFSKTSVPFLALVATAHSPYKWKARRCMDDTSHRSVRRIKSSQDEGEAFCEEDRLEGVHTKLGL